MKTSDFAKLGGWIDDPKQVELVQSQLPYACMSDCDSAIRGTGKGAVVVLHEDVISLLGKFNVRKQEIGDCQNPSALVRMADGSEKPIIDVKIGEYVLTPFGNKKKVIDYIKKPYSNRMVKLTTHYGQIESTPDHLYLQYRNKLNWSTIDSLKNEDLVFNSINEFTGPTKILNREYVEPESDYVYCIGVEDDHAFICNGYGIHNCVSMGFACGVDCLKAMEIVRLKQPEMWVAETATEPIYGLSRVEVGGRRLGNSDGSVGAWAAKAVSEYGTLIRQNYGNYNLTNYSGRVAKDWGYNGLPDILEKIAFEHLVKTVTRVTSIEQARDAIANGYPIPICGSLGFRSSRNKDGISERYGSWNHCMCLIGVDDNKEIFLCQNSWGNWNNGPKYLNQPDGSFWMRYKDAQHYFDRDSWALSNYDGFKKQKLNLRIF